MRCSFSKLSGELEIFWLTSRLYFLPFLKLGISMKFSRWSFLPFLKLGISVKFFFLNADSGKLEDVRCETKSIQSLFCEL